MDKDVHNENLTLQKEASNLLASEMSEIKGGTPDPSCPFAPDPYHDVYIK